MTEYSKSVFSDPKLLREKLGLYLKTNDALKVEIYAQAAEKFFLSGGKMMLKSTPTWSWYAFFFYFLPLVYRKLYAKAVIYYLLSIFLPITMIVLPMYFKYYVIKRFEKYLDLGDDAALVQFGGKNVIAIWVITVVIPIVLSLAISAILFFMIKSADNSSIVNNGYKDINSTVKFTTTNNAPNIDKIIQDVLNFYDKNGYMDKLFAMTNEPLGEAKGYQTKQYYDFHNNSGKTCMRLFTNFEGDIWNCQLNLRDEECSGFINDLRTSEHLYDVCNAVVSFDIFSIRSKNHTEVADVIDTLEMLVRDYEKYKISKDKSITKISQFSNAGLGDRLKSPENQGNTDTKSIYFRTQKCIDVNFEPDNGVLIMYFQNRKDDWCDDLKNNVEIKNIVSKFATQN